jgi:hypothetical protein
MEALLTLMDWLLYAVVAILCLHLLLQYLVAPFVIYFTNYQMAYPHFIPFEIDYATRQLPQGYFQYINSLRALGFTPVAHLYSEGQVRKTNIFLTLFINPVEKDAAVVYQMNCHIGSGSSALYIEFCSSFADRSELNTLNSPFPGIFNPTAEKEIYRLRKVQDPQMLYHIHNLILAKRTRTAKILPAPGDEAKELCRSMIRDLQREVETGYYYLDSAAQKYRPTLKGAFLHTWKLVWPVVWIRMYFEDARNEALIKPLKGNSSGR